LKFFTHIMPNESAKGLVGLVVTFVLASSWLYALCTTLRPRLSGEHHRPETDENVLHFPSDLEQLRKLAQHLREYNISHSCYVLVLFTSAYLYKQTFAIPGSFLLNIIAGSLFGMWTGFLMVCCLTTLGSTLCYLFSELFSREYVLYYFGEKITYLQQKVDDNSHRLLPFLLFARMFPISPSWMLNFVAPFLNIPLPIFAFSALIGLAPYNFICVQAGYILADLRSWEDVFSTSTMFKLCSFALLPLAYAMFLRRKSDSLIPANKAASSNGRCRLARKCFRFIAPLKIWRMQRNMGSMARIVDDDVDGMDKKKMPNGEILV